MSDSVVGPKDLLTNAESLQQSIDQAVAEPSNVRMPAARRAHSMRPYYALLAAAIVTPAILFGIVAWQTREYMLSNATTDVERTVELSVSGTRPAADRPIACRTGQRVYARHDLGRDPAFRSAPPYLKRLAAEYPQAGVLFMIDGSGTGRASNLYPPSRRLPRRIATISGRCEAATPASPSGPCRKAEPAASSTSISRYAVKDRRMPSMVSSSRAHARVLSRTSGRRSFRRQARCSEPTATTARSSPPPPCRPRRFHTHADIENHAGSEPRGQWNV